MCHKVRLAHNHFLSTNWHSNKHCITTCNTHNTNQITDISTLHSLYTSSSTWHHQHAEQCCIYHTMRFRPDRPSDIPPNAGQAGFQKWIRYTTYT